MILRAPSGLTPGRRPRLLLAAVVAALALLGGAIGLARPRLNLELATARRRVAPGLVHERLTSPPAAGRLPLSVNLLRVDLRRTRLQIALARGQVAGKETTSSIARRLGALAAVNGGFFTMRGVYQGDPEGFFMIEGRVLSEPAERRSSFGVCRRGPLQEVVVDQLRLVTEISGLAARPLRATGVNRARGKDDLILYTPEFGPSTLTDGGGAELVIRGGRIVAGQAGAGASAIPDDGFVISAAGRFARALTAAALDRAGSVVVTHRLRSMLHPRQAVRREGCSYTSAGPTLALGGRRRSAFLREGEKFKARFSRVRHPRTAVGIVDRHRLLLVVVDGRQAGLSAGMSLDELRRLLRRRGARDVYNLDGGGSTTMVIQDKIVNSPSDLLGERPVSDALLLFARE